MKKIIKGEKDKKKTNYREKKLFIVIALTY
jgi:hypothetical protein